MNPDAHLARSSAHHLVAAALESQTEAFAHLTFLDKLALWASWAAAAGIFLTLGWMAMAPEDPYGAVSLLLRSSASSMWVQAAGLAVVTSAIATVLVGRTLPYAGAFAAALGLAVVSLRGGTAESLLIAARTSDLGTSSLAMRMAFESITWIGVMVLSFLISAGIARWCFANAASAASAVTPARKQLPAPAFVAIALGIGLLAFNILGAGMHSREIRHTQVLFVVGASIWLGCYFAYRVVPVRGIAWYVMTVLFMVLASYVWASLQADSPNLPVSLPPSNYLRVLPIQFVSVGVAAAIAAYWSNSRHHEERAGMEEDARDLEGGR